MVVKSAYVKVLDQRPSASIFLGMGLGLGLGLFNLSLEV